MNNDSIDSWFRVEDCLRPIIIIIHSSNFFFFLPLLNSSLYFELFMVEVFI